MELKIGTTFTGRSFTGRVVVLKVDELNNELRVQLTKPLNTIAGPDFSVWEETWNLQHTRWGIESYEYYPKTFPKDWP